MDKNLKELDIDIDVTGVGKALQEDVFKQLVSVDGIEDYLREVLASDLKRHFAANSPIEQMMVKGAYLRTMYLLKSIRKQSEKKRPAPKTKSVLPSTRYAR